jgi:hypothetical protein
VGGGGEGCLGCVLWGECCQALHTRCMLLHVGIIMVLASRNPFLCGSGSALWLSLCVGALPGKGMEKRGLAYRMAKMCKFCVDVRSCGCAAAGVQVDW